MEVEKLIHDCGWFLVYSVLAVCGLIVLVVWVNSMFKKAIPAPLSVPKMRFKPTTNPEDNPTIPEEELQG